jgi:thiol-disulfide isomerase/thioredoxin
VVSFLTPLLLLLWIGGGEKELLQEGGRVGEPVVRTIDLSVLERLKVERSGRALLVNVWATWCAPCVEEFPDLVRLHEAYADRGLDVVVLSIDFDDEVESKVKPFLRKMKATMPAYINAFDKPEELMNALDEGWSGAVPATFVFDTKGRLSQSVIGKQSLEEFTQLVRPLLHER